MPCRLVTISSGLLGLLLAGPVAAFASPLVTLTTQTESAQPAITIWIHGTRLLPSQLFKNFFYSKKGLHPAHELEEKYYQRRIANHLIASNRSVFCPEGFYLFGWNGKLSTRERERAATQLYSDLKKVRDSFLQTYQKEPLIRIIAHSHGGNVALLLDKVKDGADTSFKIHELILLATPVQQHTMHHACSPLFNKIYSLYSTADWIQVMDPQCLHTFDVPLFSHRRFPEHERITQIAIKINKRSPMHMDFIRPNFLRHITRILTHIETPAFKTSNRGSFIQLHVHSPRSIKSRGTKANGAVKKSVLV